MILTDKILLVEPVGFGFNKQTAIDNKFQSNNNSTNIRFQFENLKSLLKTGGITVVDFKPSEENTPDAVYPNNWFSTFPDKRLIIYPMMAENRRLEKRPEFIEILKEKYSPMNDLSFLEDQGEFLEGTGSLVIDHQLKIAFACISSRTTEKAISEWEKVTGYRVIKFTAIDENDFPVYHTNVILTLSEKFALICMDSIPRSEQSKITESILSSGREIISISFEQVRKFCGNCLAVTNKDREQLLVMSDQARNAFTKEQLKQIEKSCKIICSDLSEIELIGGGGARCMMGELF